MTRRRVYGLLVLFLLMARASSADFASGAIISVTSSPFVLDAPGGTFSFSVLITNTGTQSFTITELTDDQYGDLTLISGTNTCTNAVGAVLAPNAQYLCAFETSFTGAAGDIRESITTVRVQSPSGASDSVSTSEGFVMIRVSGPAIRVQVEGPEKLWEPGGTADSYFSVYNVGSVDLTFTEITDTLPGNLTDFFVGETISPGVLVEVGSARTLSGIGQYTRTISATAQDGQRNPVTDSATGTVVVADVQPDPAVTKTPDVSSLPAPGGPVTFTVVVTNRSSEAVTIRSLTDVPHGDLSTQGTCTDAIGKSLAGAPSDANTYTCSFTVPLDGCAEDSIADTVSVTLGDDENNTATASAAAEVLLTPAELPPDDDEGPGGNDCAPFADSDESA